MKKIELNINQLKIDSFEISKNNSKSGTVNGFHKTEMIYCVTDMVQECATEYCPESYQLTDCTCIKEC